MKLRNYLNEEKLQRYVEDGIVSMKFHNELPLAIFTYSRHCVYTQLWDDVTEKCRGLIVDIDSGDIVARPFEKFFDFGDPRRPETHPENLPARLPIIVEKLNGSLGIHYQYKGHEGIASKASFHSVHAQWATGPVQEELCKRAVARRLHAGLRDDLRVG